MHQNGSLYAYTAGNFAKSETLFKTGVASLDANAFESLEALFSAFDNLQPSLYGVARAKAGKFFFHLLALNTLDQIHGGYPSLNESCLPLGDTIPVGYSLLTIDTPHG